MVMTNTIIFSVQTKTHAKSALIDQSIFFRATTRTTLPFMATPGGGKDATVTGTLEVAVGLGGEVIKVKSTLRGLKPGSGQAMWSTASLSLRLAVMSVCSVAFPSRG